MLLDFEILDGESLGFEVQNKQLESLDASVGGKRWITLLLFNLMITSGL